MLQLLVSNTLEEKMTSVNQLNQVLGVSKKPVKIQNNIRFNTYLMINKKFMVYSGVADDLVEKQRTELDKRFFEYSIAKKYLHKIK